MRWLVLVVATATGLALPGAAAATRLVSSTPLPPEYQQWLDAALVPTPRGTITIYQRACPGSPEDFACVFYADPRSGAGEAGTSAPGRLRRAYAAGPRTIYLAPKFRAAPVDFQRAVLLHEVGHIFDYRHLSASDRRAFARLVGRADERWISETPEGTYPLVEWFAMAYSDCALGLPQPSGSLGYEPSEAAHAEVCGLIRRAGERARGSGWSRGRSTNH